MSSSCCKFSYFHIFLNHDHNYNCILGFVSEQNQDSDVSWFPIHRALCLSEESTGVEEKLEKITKLLDSVVARLKEDDLRKLEADQQVTHLRWKQEAAGTQ